MLKFEHEEVVNCLLEALNSKYNGVKYWCTQICSLYPDERLIVPLERLLNDHNEDIYFLMCHGMWSAWFRCQENIQNTVFTQKVSAVFFL